MNNKTTSPKKARGSRMKQTQLMSERLKHRMSYQYRLSGEYPAPSKTSGIAWNVPGEHHGNGNNK
ncbi:hypothetical protein E2C01_008789 [Portunus trituberculatus]|uniref:Uncharacterized protein n=1 Tax=Portunus trituberculatus TaxID=210409 RepID=A0A5B7D5L5_PORTR|nr:hypothetical protein [Portunus trituberculatus]